MHGPAAPARASRLLANQLSHELYGRQTFGQRMSMTPMGTENSIVRPQLRAYASRDCLLPHVGMARAVNESARMAASELFLAGPYQLHRAIQESHVRCYTVIICTN